MKLGAIVLLRRVSTILRRGPLGGGSWNWLPWRQARIREEEASRMRFLAIAALIADGDM